MMSTAAALPGILRPWMADLIEVFSSRTQNHVLILITGALLAPGRRTVASVLRVMGLGQVRSFTTYHRLLNRNVWSGRALACRLLARLVCAFVPDGPIVLGLDDTLERRRGAKITAKGIDRDPVRSSHSHFVKASGLRWLSLMLLAPVPFAGRVWALPVLTVLAPSERFHRERGMRHKTLLDWGRQMLLQARRWLPERPIVAVTDTSFAALEFLAAVRQHVWVVTRLRLDANLFAPEPPRRPGQRGRPRRKGERLRKLEERLGAGHFKRSGLRGTVMIESRAELSSDFASPPRGVRRLGFRQYPGTSSAVAHPIARYVLNARGVATLEA